MLSRPLTLALTLPLTPTLSKDGQSHLLNDGCTVCESVRS
jgi:hypothetical protein